MGEIGIPRREYLYELTHCDMLMIERGYERRHNYHWAAARWETYHIMSAQIGTEAMKNAGINSPADLLKLPSDRASQSEYDGGPTDEEIEQIRREIIEENRRAELKQKTDA